MKKNLQLAVCLMVGILLGNLISVRVGAQTFTGNTGTVSAETFTGSALGTHTHTLTAMGTNGTSTVTGTMNSFDNRPAFVKVIFCQKS